MVKLATLFNLEPGEEKLVLSNFLQSVFIGFPRLFTLTVATSLFLGHYSVGDLPYVYLASSFVVLAAGSIHLYFEKKVSFIKLRSGTLLVLSVVSASFFILLAVTEISWLAIALHVWLPVEIVMTDIVLWSTANRLFTVRQSKRLFSLVGAGTITTVIVGGLLTPYLVPIITTPGLLIFSLTGLLLAFFNLQRINRLFKDKLAKGTIKRDKESDHISQSVLALFKDRYLLLIFILFAFFSQTIYLFVDNIFYHQISSKYPSADQVAGFLGRFWSIYGISSLLFRSFIASRWMSHVGIFGGILTSQMVVGICMGFIVIYDSFLSLGAVVIFWLVATSKQLERIFTGAITVPAYLTLYQPLPPEQRSRVQTVTESIMGPIGGMLTSGLLLILTKNLEFGTVVLSAVLLVIVIVYGFVCHLTIKEYRQALTVALNRRGFVGADLSLEDSWNLQILEKGVESHRPKEILYCLKLLEEIKHPRLNEHLLNLINHADVEVREGVYQLIEKLATEDCFESLQKRLAIEKLPRLRGALLRALASTGNADVFDLIEPYLSSGQTEIRQGAMVALVRHCGIEGAVSAGGTLMKLLKSPSAEEREFAATVLGEIGISTFYRGLVLLLRDNNIEVRKAALTASSQLNNHKLWPLVIENLNSLPTREAAVRALIQAGESALSSLEIAYADSQQSPKTRREIIHLYGRIKSKQTIHLLLKKLSEIDRNLRYEILWSLYLCGYQASEEERGKIEQLLIDEVFYGVKVLTMQRDLQAVKEAAMLFSALDYELEKTQGRVFLLLSAIYSSELIIRIWNNFNESSLDKKDLAIELLENTISKEYKAIVMPLLEMSRQIYSATPEDLSEPSIWIGEIISTPEIWGNPWTRACAIDVAAKMPAMADIANTYLPMLLEDYDPLVRETAAYALGMGTKETFSMLEKVKILKSAAIFSKIPDEVLAEVAPLLEGTVVEPGKTVFRKGELGTSMYIIAEGLLRVHDGERTLVELGEGNIFGEFSALDPEPRAASVTGIKQSLLFEISQEELHTLIENHIEVAKGIIQILCQRLRDLISKKSGEKNTQKVIKTPHKATLPAVDEEEVLGFQHEDELALIEKVIILKTVSIFADTPDNVLSDIGAMTEETFLRKNETLFRKGDVGTAMYIVVSGRVQVHDGSRIIAELGERALIGEMAVLSSEPRTASVTAITDTLLLSLTQTALFELMWGQNKIVRGIIRVLIQRLRGL